MHPTLSPLTPASAGARGPVSLTPWAYPHDEVLRRYDVDPLCGLSLAEARRRCGAVGPNAVTPVAVSPVLHAPVSAWARIGAALARWSGLSAVRRIWNAAPPAAPGTFPALLARVLREDRVLEVPAADVVPGDILLLAQGDTVVADGRLLDVVEMRVDEQALTGWSFPSSRCVAPVGNSWTPPADRRSMVHAGSRVVYGAGIAVAVATGPLTELGRAGLDAGRTVAAQTPPTAPGDDEDFDDAAAVYRAPVMPISFRLRPARADKAGRTWSRTGR